ncbi:hypothetical protein ACWEBX_03325 [Streptomyces sp. NPDC005070]
MHWHGFGPWIGTGKEYGKEALRRPGRGPGDGQTAAFLASRVPSMQTGHALMRTGLVAGTWTDVRDAVDWLAGLYGTAQPIERTDGGIAYLDADTKASYALDALPRGLDVVWAYWTQSRLLASYSVVCCPHRDIDVPCPTRDRQLVAAR